MHGLGIISALLYGSLLTVAFLIGTVISIWNDPLEFLSVYWFPILLLLFGVTKAIVQGWNEKA